MALTAYRMTGELARLFRKRAGAYVKGVRTDRGLTQREVATRLGLDYYTMVSAIENGHSRVPSEAVEAWATALETPADEFARHLLEWCDPFMFKALYGGLDPIEKVFQHDKGRGGKKPTV